MHVHVYIQVQCMCTCTCRPPMCMTNNKDGECVDFLLFHFRLASSASLCAVHVNMFIRIFMYLYVPQCA